MMGPVSADDAHRIESDRVIRRPTRCLNNAPFDLIANSVGRYRLSTVDRVDRAHHLYATGLAFQGDFDSDRQVGGQIFCNGRTQIPGPWSRGREPLGQPNFPPQVTISSWARGSQTSVEVRRPHLKTPGLLTGTAAKRETSMIFQVKDGPAVPVGDHPPC